MGHISARSIQVIQEDQKIRVDEEFLSFLAEVIWCLFKFDVRIKKENWKRDICGD